MSTRKLSSCKEAFNLDFGSSETPEPPRRGIKRKASNKRAALAGVPPDKRPMDTQKHNEGVSTKFSCPEKEEEARQNLIRGDTEDSKDEYQDESIPFGESAARGNPMVRHSQRCMGNMMEVAEEEEEDDLVEPAIGQAGTKNNRAVLPPMLQEKWRKLQHAFRLRRQAADGDESAKRRLTRLNKGKSIKEQIDEIESELLDLDKFTRGYEKLYWEKKKECSSASTASRKYKKKGKGNAQSCQKSRLNDQLDLVHLMRLEANFRLAALKSDRQFNKGFVQSTVTHRKEAEVQVEISDDETDRSMSDDSDFVVNRSEIHGHLGLTEMKTRLTLIYADRIMLQKKMDSWIERAAWDPIHQDEFKVLLKQKYEKDLAYFKWKTELEKLRETIGAKNSMRANGSDGDIHIEGQLDGRFVNKVKPLPQTVDQFPRENIQPIQYWANDRLRPGNNETSAANPPSIGHQIGNINDDADPVKDFQATNQVLDSTYYILSDVSEHTSQTPVNLLELTESHNAESRNENELTPNLRHASNDGGLVQEFSGSKAYEAFSAALESLSRLSPRTLDGIIDIALKDFTSPAPPNVLEPGQDEVRSHEELLVSDIPIEGHDKYGTDFFVENKESSDQDIGAEETVDDGNLEPGDGNELMDSGQQTL